MHSYEKIVVLVESITGIIGISLNSLLLVCMIRSTPVYFANFGIMMKAHAFFDLCTAIGGFMTMTRAIPIGWSLVNINYGPCSHFGPTVCYLFTVILLGGAVYSSLIILGSFYFRFRVIRNLSPTIKDTVLILICVSFPVPTLLTVSYAISMARPGFAETTLYTLYPDYAGKSCTVIGNEDLRSIPMTLTLFVLCIAALPVYSTILTIRWKILQIIDKSSQLMSRKAIGMHRKFVNMLSAQGALPLVQMFALIAFLLGFFDIFHHPVVEISTFMVGDTTATFSPFIVLIFVEHYRMKVLALLGIGQDKMENRQMQTWGTISSLSRV